MFPVRNIHQVEITSRCNLRCQYCVHRSMSRPKLDMEWDVYAAAVAHARRFQAAGTQGSLNLAGIGESTMHPRFVDMVRHARQELGEGQEIVLATNGLLVDEALADALAPLRPRVYVSLHRPERAKRAVDALADRGLLAGVSADPAIAGTDWAGQIKWKVRAPRTPCPWVVGGWAIVLSDGRMSRCSFDGEGHGTIRYADGTEARIDDEYNTGAWQTSPYSLCATCHQDVGAPLQAEVAA